ncbi:hypothetical protein ACHAWF_014623 [Thalassiosira exigua]
MHCPVMIRGITVVASLLAAIHGAVAFSSARNGGRRLPAPQRLQRGVGAGAGAGVARTGPSTALSMAQAASGVRKTTLTDETTWRVRLLLNDVTTAKGKKLDGQLFVLEGSFLEEDGYEPPQGSFRTKPKQSAEGEEGAPSAMTLEVKSSYWKLSEDPDDPKDGLWVWGLFKEPLYPYMLLQMETEELALPSSSGSGEDGDGDSIPPLKLYARISHARSNEAGVELQAANLNVRVLERVQLPGASVDLYEEEPVGQISFQPL